MRLQIGITCLVVAASLSPLAFSGETQCSAIREAIPLCNVLADAAKYDDKDIVVSGVYYRVIHGSILTAPACEKAKVNMRSASDWKAEKRALKVLNSRARKNQGTEIVLRGTFRVARDSCFGQTCSLYEIEGHELLCAEAPKPEASATPSHEAGHAQDSNSEK